MRYAKIASTESQTDAIPAKKVATQSNPRPMSRTTQTSSNPIINWKIDQIFAIFSPILYYSEII